MRVEANQSGLTLVEVLAAVVIVTIILLSFVLVFSQAARTTKNSTEIFDATYYAQKEMEHIYQLAQTTAFDNKEQAITYINEVADESSQERDARKKYVYVKTSSNTFEKVGNVVEDPNNAYYYELTCQELPLRLTNIMIKVYDQKGGILKAQMESTYEWR